MQTSQTGVDLIKRFEGLSLQAVQLPGERFWSIGYGHYGADVMPGSNTTKEEAEALLRKDLRQFENYVNSYAKQWAKFVPNQNEFDALVSFTYNCGAGCLKQLIQGRTSNEVAEHWMAYTASANEAFREGLRNRREKELQLFQTPVEKSGAGDYPSSWAKEATQWAKENGLFAGDGAGNYDWQQPISREALAAVLHRFASQHGLIP